MQFLSCWEMPQTFALLSRTVPVCFLICSFFEMIKKYKEFLTLSKFLLIIKVYLWNENPDYNSDKGCF